MTLVKFWSSSHRQLTEGLGRVRAGVVVKPWSNRAGVVVKRWSNRAGKVVKRRSNRDEAAGGVEGEAGGAAEEEGPARGQHGSPEEVRHVPRARGCRGVTDGSQGVMHRGL